VTCSGIGDKTPTGAIATCEWGDPNTLDFGDTASSIIYPSEVKMVTFIYKKDTAPPSGGIWNIPGTNPPIDLAHTQTKDGETVSYVHAGQTLKVNANLTYNYNVNVSIPIAVIGSKRYTDMLINGKIQLIDLTSQYTGGPVKATLWTPKQPVRTHEPSVVVASVLNEGTGVIKNIKYIIAIPAALFDTSNMDSAQGLSSFTTCDSVPQALWNAAHTAITYYTVSCTYSKEIKPQEFKRVSFFINPQMDDQTEGTTSQINGYVEYTYVKTSSQSLTIAPAPAQ
jgi:hypothetical protein